MLWGSYKDSRVSVIHDEVPCSCAGRGYSARGEPLVQGLEAVGQMHPYQPVQPGDGGASQGWESSKKGHKCHESNAQDDEHNGGEGAHGFESAPRWTTRGIVYV